ncbi:NaeI family type II restriction endonuclease [Arthrobacter sp. lap29]|uniref:NaeI family type II restriction endonuclease n=1 Tax=Arthrobacter sp. lap29 TaxID=3056122 RepID=UPI0028F719D4|nr:NaeI family type II restriction endonuclease [Arthrobacter sp. lap29]
MTSHPLETLLTGAVNDAVEYVLDGARTWRFDLNSPDVDSDERATVGTKLQYRVLAALDLIKEPPLDTTILGIAVELKGTVRTNWMIPREGQCQICLLIQVDAKNDRHQVLLMRTHRIWLNRGNGDQKRNIMADAIRTYALPVLPWTPLPRNPLKLLTSEQKAVVFNLKEGIKRRLTALFGYLPEVVIPRITIETVGANRKDAARRAREAKFDVYTQHGLVVLMGTWIPQQELAARHGFDLSGEAWVAIRPETLGTDFEVAKAMSFATSQRT